MSEIADRLANFKPFSDRSSQDDDDNGEAIDETTVAGSGHGARQSDIKLHQLRVSNALKKFMVDERILSEADCGLGIEGSPRPLQELVSRPHIHVPEELTDRSHPLPEYFISSSHNTYLLAHQLYGESSAAAYKTALRTGSRCVEIDAWDNDDNPDEPRVTHGYTLVSNVPFREVCETIRDVWDKEAAEAVDASGYRASPILISLENHCAEYGQFRLVQIMRDVWGDRLLDQAVREAGHAEQDGGQHVTLAELGSKIAVIVEYHLDGEMEDDCDSGGDQCPEDEEAARQAYKEMKKTGSKFIIPELADLGVYAQSVKPSDGSWYLEGALRDGPHHHLINVSESGLKSLLPEYNTAISNHNAHHLMRVFPRGTRISSDNLKPVPFWGIGAQICALNWQNFGTSNQLNEALFSGSDGYVLKPAALRHGGSGNANTGKMKKLRLHVAGATDVPVGRDYNPDSIRPYLTCTLYHPDDLKNCPGKRKTSPYKHHKLGFLHRGENPPPTDPIWNETLEWKYEDNELVFMRLLLKSDESWAKNPMFSVAAVRIMYTVSDWCFIRMLDMKGRESKCSVLVRFEVVDA